MADKTINSNYIGRGINHFTGEQCDQIVGGLIKTSSDGGTNTVELCTTSEEVFNKLNIHVDAAVNYAGLDIKGRADFATELTKKKNTTTVLIFVEKSISKTLTEPKFTQSVKNASVRDIVRAGGDSYMSSVREGAQYIAAYSFTASSEESKSDLDTALKIDYKNMFKVNASVKIDDFTQKTSSTLHITQIHYGGKSLRVSTDINSIIAFADEFSNGDIENPTLLDYDTSSYNDVPGAPSGFEVVHAWTMMYKQPSISGYSLATIETQANFVLSQYEVVMNLYQFYGRDDFVKGLDGTEKTKVKDIIKAIGDWRKSFQVDKSPELPKVNLNDMVVPKASFKLQEQRGDKWIGKQTGGHSFNYFHESWINDFTYVKKIKAYVDEAIFHGIEFTFAKVDPTNPYGGDTAKWTYPVEGTATGTSIEKEFLPAEVRKAGGWSLSFGWAKDKDNKDCVSGLFFEYWGSAPYEMKTKSGYGGNANDWMLPGDHAWVGFRGNAGTYVDGLLPQAVQFFHPIMYKASMKYGISAG